MVQVPDMDDLTMAAFERRAAEAERRLAVLESSRAEAGGASSVASPAVLKELEQIRATMAAAKAEHSALQQRAAQLETENSKLKYRAEHLVSAVREGDQRLKDALFGEAEAVNHLREQFSYMKDTS